MIEVRLTGMDADSYIRDKKKDSIIEMLTSDLEEAHKKIEERDKENKVLQNRIKAIIKKQRKAEPDEDASYGVQKAIEKITDLRKSTPKADFSKKPRQQKWTASEKSIILWRLNPASTASKSERTLANLVNKLPNRSEDSIRYMVRKLGGVVAKGVLYAQGKV